LLFAEFPMPDRRLILSALLVAATLPGTAQAQDFLSRAEIEGHMRESVFCYYPDDRFACAWAELYTALNDDHAVLQSASAVWDAPMSVLEFRVEWDGNALCIDEATQGLLSAREAEGYRFPFSLAGLELLPAEELPALVEEFRAGSPGLSCFRYSADAANPGQLLQHVFRDGVGQPDLDPVALIPLVAGGVAINPS